MKKQKNDRMGKNKNPNGNFSNAFKEVCRELGSDWNPNNAKLRRRAHDALPGNFWDVDKDAMDFGDLKERIKDAIRYHRNG